MVLEALPHQETLLDLDFQVIPLGPLSPVNLCPPDLLLCLLVLGLLIILAVPLALGILAPRCPHHPQVLEGLDLVHPCLQCSLALHLPQGTPDHQLNLRPGLYSLVQVGQKVQPPLEVLWILGDL